MTVGTAKSISASLIYVLASFIILKGLYFNLNLSLEISINPIIITLLGVVVVGGFWSSSAVAGILGALMGRIYAEDE